MLERVLNRPVKTRHVPIRFMDLIIGALDLFSRIKPNLFTKAELARIGRYYATESMLTLTERGYDAAATPSYGSDTLEDHYAALVSGRETTSLGSHAVFDKARA